MKKEVFLTSSIVFIILAVSFFAALNYQKPEVLALLNLVVLVGLTGVTAVYAYFTERMAKSAKAQADASVKMVDEMREQRMDEAKPIVLLRLEIKDEEFVTVPGKFDLLVLNAGKGPAVNLHAALWHAKKTCYIDTTKGYLSPGEEWRAKITSSLDVIEQEVGWLPELQTKVGRSEIAVAVEYRDIHHRRWASFMRFERPFAGEELTDWSGKPIEAPEKIAIEDEQDIVELKK